MTTLAPRAEFSQLSAKRLSDVLATHDALAIEEALVRRYLCAKSIGRPKNRVLAGIQSSRKSEALSADAALEGVEIRTLDDLVKAFEILARSEEETDNGTVFTPDWVANQLAEEVISPARKDARVVDPACGCGALLAAALQRLHKLNEGEKSAADIIANQLFGCDIDPHGIRRVKLLLSLTAVELGSDEPKYEFGKNLVARDSLLLAEWKGATFDVVIGNPPYVRYHQLDEEHRALYSQHWSVLSLGNFNLYFAFFELADALCAPGGAIAYITPNGYFRASSGRPLREWMVAKMKPTKIIDFGGAAVFPGAMTYTAMTFADRARPKTDLLYVEAEPHARPKPGDFAAVPLSTLANGPWRLVGKHHSEGIARAQSGGRPLSEVADIRFGVATLRDSHYLLSGEVRDGKYVKRLDGKEFLIEAEATVPAVRASEVASQKELDKCATRIIFPYTRDDAGQASVWSEDRLAEFTGAHEYLAAIAPELAKRDHGKKTYAAWFAYGRTQGLGAWQGTRLLTPLYAARPRFLVDKTNDRVFLNGCAIAPKSGTGISVRLLAALLNSSVLHYFVEQTSSPITGGYFSYQKGPLSTFHIHDEAIRQQKAILAATGAERQELIAHIYGVKLPEKYLTA